ncbi:MAG: hypothetical protein KF799_09055 [Bdellovibrionales bacterium]|nr:hypothetical protein [Bdellovibrionales bacterium]
MPTKSVKKSVTRKARKTTPKKKTITNLTKPQAKKAKKTPPTAERQGQKRGFMWKLLEQKKARQLEHPAHRMGGTANPHERVQQPNGAGFTRFHGPRRKAA